VTPAGATAAPAGGAAPGAPGVDEQYLPADKVGLGTSTTTGSTVWFTVQKSGGLGEIFYPTIDSPSARALTFVVADRQGHAERAGDVADVRASLADERSLSFRQEFTERRGRWRLTAEYVSDPQRSTVLVDVKFAASGWRPYDVYALYDPALGNSRGNDAGRTNGTALLATDAATGVSSAFVGSPSFTATSSGFAGTSDGWTDLKADGRLDGRYTSAVAGSLVQTARTGLTGRPGHEHATLALGFGPDAGAALASARATLRPRFDAVAGAYARGWRRYLDRLAPPPSSVDGSRQLYRVAAMVLAAAEDKAHRGAYVAAPAAPGVRPRRPVRPVPPGVVTRPVPDRHRVDRIRRHGRREPGARLPVHRPAEAGRLVPAELPRRRHAGVGRPATRRGGTYAPPRHAPDTRPPHCPVVHPRTGSQIAGLVCAAYLARANGDEASSARYLATADDWQSNVKGWTVTTNGPYSSGPYFLRLTKDGNPNAGTTYDIGDSGPSNVDQRTVVDPSFLDLVRLGVLPASDPAVVNTLGVIDAKLGYRTRNGFFWHRASFDGYGEKANGDPWDFGLPDDSLITRGRGWPLLNGERGEYRLAAGDTRGARAELATLARAAGPGLMLPEQVWDLQAPPGVVPGTPTTSATPLTWSHAQFLRLARNVAAGRVLEQPDIVAQRYAPG